ncbi:hypothetical protein D3C78_795840 [compost metagenome]
MRIWRSRRGSALTSRLPSGRWLSSCSCSSPACGRTSSRHSFITWRTSTVSRVTEVFSASMRARSRMSSTSMRKWLLATMISPAYWAWAVSSGCSPSSSWISWANPCTALSGVRSSWLMLDRNRVLATLAAWACWLARLSASWVALRSSMSTWVPDRRRRWPPSGLCSITRPRLSSQW